MIRLSVEFSIGVTLVLTSRSNSKMYSCINQDKDTTIWTRTTGYLDSLVKEGILTTSTEIQDSLQISHGTQLPAYFNEAELSTNSH
jgi:hypothetical protein